MLYVTPEDYEIAERNGINAENVTQRVYVYGWEIERAITQPLTIRRKVDPLWEEWKQVAEENGVYKSLFNQRIKASGWSPEKAATTPIRNGRPLNTEWTEEEREQARKNGLDKNYMSVVKARIRLGWTREEALRTPILSEDERAKRVARGTRKYHERRKRDGRNENLRIN